jgi:hypothetical protein
MKNYIMIILLTLVASIMISSTRNVKADISTEVITNTDSSEIASLDSYDEALNTEIAATAKTTVKTSVKATVKTSVKATSTAYHNYNVTKSYDTVIKSPSYQDIYRSNKLVYGHNSSNLLGSAKALGVDSTFTLTENGITATYKVADVAIFQKLDDYTLGYCTSGYNDCTGSTYYMSTFQNATFMGKTYSVALFTCDGTSLGNGDATHRRVVFAYEV